MQRGVVGLEVLLKGREITIIFLTFPHPMTWHMCCRFFFFSPGTAKKSMSFSFNSILGLDLGSGKRLQRMELFAR
jgi:hypothetical protein